VHAALAASLGAYGLIFLMFRSRLTGLSSLPPPSPRLSLILGMIGVSQFWFASWASRRILRSRRSPVGQRVRRAFFLRAAAAEAIALYGLLAGFQGAPLGQVASLFAVSAVALSVCAPTRSAWKEAAGLAESSGP